MNRSPLDDEELVRRVRAGVKTGDSRDFEILVQRHASHVLANCRHLTRSPDDAEDLAQDVFVKAYFALGRFEGRSQFRTWLQRIKINHCLNFVRARNGRQFVDVTDGALEGERRLHEEAIAEASLMAADQRAHITAVLDSMAATLRVPLILRDADELPYDEIARTLGVSLSAAKMRVMRARQVFRERYRARTAAQEQQASDAAHAYDTSHGTNGTNGTNGANGAKGTNGANGANGANGTKGSNGTNSASGANGPNGTTGAKSANGTNGVNGTTRTNGTNGANGTNGVNGHGAHHHDHVPALHRNGRGLRLLAHDRTRNRGGAR